MEEMENTSELAQVNIESDQQTISSINSTETEEESLHPISENFSADEIDEETAQKLKGDTIGNTVYSEVFVLRTVMQLSDLKWNGDVENDLCFLWDMTEEKEVCNYLFKIGFPSLACIAIQKYPEENRCLEIIVGILGNIYSVDCSDCPYYRIMANEDIAIVLSLLQSADPLILIQVVRFLHAIAYKCDKITFINMEIMETLSFILVNSTNTELLVATMKAFAMVTSDLKLSEQLFRGRYIKYALTAYNFVTTNDGQQFSLETAEQKLSVKYLIEIVCNLCIYIDTLKIFRLFDEIEEARNDNTNQLSTAEFADKISQLLHYYNNDDEFVLTTDDFRYYIDAISYIFRTLSIEYVSTIFITLLKMLITLINNNSEDIEEIAEFFCYFISITYPQVLTKDMLNNISCHQDLIKVIDIIKENSYNFEFDYKENFKTMYFILKNQLNQEQNE